MNLLDSVIKGKTLEGVIVLLRFVNIDIKIKIDEIRIILFLYP